MALSILWVSIFMTSILFANICVISPGFVSVSRLCPKCHIWAHNPWNEHICQLNKKTYADSSFCKPTYVDNFFLFPSWIDLDHWDQEGYLFARQLGTVDPVQSSWLNLRPPCLSIHHNVLVLDREKPWTAHFISCLSYEGAGVMLPWQKGREESSLLHECRNLAEYRTESEHPVLISPYHT